jgi:hypothetical protein
VPTHRAPDGTALDDATRAAFEGARVALADAMAVDDEASVRDAVCALREALGPMQGVAEAAADYRKVSGATPAPEALRDTVFATLQASVFDTSYEAWRGGDTDGASMTDPLRVPCLTLATYLDAASVLSGASRDALMARAALAAEWLVSVQAPSGAFPYPDLTTAADAWVAACVADGHSDAECTGSLPRSYQLARDALAAWQAAGAPPEARANGWWLDVSFFDDGGLQFDTGVCGSALLQAASALDEPRYLDAARRAGAWAGDQRVVPNWNYNAFSVGLLARLDAAEPDQRWADLALAKARRGVLPGALPDGRWFDPHNARLVYHEILLGNLAALDAQVDDPWLDATLAVAAWRSSDELTRRGVTALDDGIAAHTLLRTLGRDDTDTLERLVDGATDADQATSLGAVRWLAWRLGPGP